MTAAPTNRHTIQYRIRNHDLKDPSRPVEVHASPEDIARLARDGYLAEPGMLSPAQVGQLRTALDEVAHAFSTLSTAAPITVCA